MCYIYYQSKQILIWLTCPYTGKTERGLQNLTFRLLEALRRVFEVLKKEWCYQCFHSVKL